MRWDCEWRSGQHSPVKYLGASRVGQLNRGDIVYIYAERGTNEIQSGMWDYWYYISTLSDKSRSIYDDTWIRGSEIEPFLGFHNRRLSITENPLYSLPLVLKQDISSLFQKPTSVQDVKPEYEGFLPVISYNYPGFNIEVFDKAADKVQFVYRVTVTSKTDVILLKYGINVGVNKNYVTKCLGVPDRQEDEYWIYYHPDPKNTLAIKIENDWVSLIQWVAEVP